jgi:hypothetical protein
MGWILFGLLLVAALGAAFIRRSTQIASPSADWVVEPLKLLSPAEQELYAQLQAAFPQHVVFVHVSFAKLLRMRRSDGPMNVFQRYYRMAAPFVVCRKDSMPVVVVDAITSGEGGPRSREQRHRAAVLEASGLLYLGVAIDGRIPRAEELRSRVRALLQGRQGGGRADPAAAQPHTTAPAAPPARAAVGPVRRIMRPFLGRRDEAPPARSKVA